MEIEVIGYFVDKDGEKNNARDVFIVINEIGDSRGGLTIYCPIGQHGSASVDYINSCEKITKEEYMEASKNFYTPKEYL